MVISFARLPAAPPPALRRHRPSLSQQNIAKRPPHGLRSVHLPDELVDVALTVAVVAALDEVLELALPPATGRVGELERPEEACDLLEVGADGVDLVDEILDREDVVLAECGLDRGVVGERNALLVDLAVAALVDELADRLQVRLAEEIIRIRGDIRGM